jgi:phospholipase C
MNATDQHPSQYVGVIAHEVRVTLAPSCSDVVFGERLMKTVYDALRASRFWNDTVLIVTYDEHGTTSVLKY